VAEKLPAREEEVVFVEGVHLLKVRKVEAWICRSSGYTSE